jgi:hypothetical protein
MTFSWIIQLFWRRWPFYVLGPIWRKMEWSDGTGTDVEWISSWLPNTNKLRPSVQTFSRLQYFRLSVLLILVWECKKVYSDMAVMLMVAFHHQYQVFAFCIPPEDSVLGIATDYELGDRGVQVRFPVGARIVFFSTSFIPALRFTQPPIQGVPGALSREKSGRGVKLTTHHQLLPRSRKCGSIPALPHTPSWHSA